MNTSELLGNIKTSKDRNIKTISSMAIMGLGQLLYKQWVKGLMFLFIEIGFILYFIFVGAASIKGFITLGTLETNQWYGIEGDNSVNFLLMGIFTIILMAFYVLCYVCNVKDIVKTKKSIESGKQPLKIKNELASIFEDKFYVIILFLPVIFIVVFNILPNMFMITISLTNYGGDIVPPALVDWIGFKNFKKVFSLTQFTSTFGKILSWNLIWAVLSTFCNYFLGLGLALLINKKCVRGKSFWRAFPIFAYAVPSFITLLSFKYMLSYGGPINQIIVNNGGKAIGFFDMDAKWTARFLGVAINAWINIPISMLMATGILSNVNSELYESAKMDGANAWKQFFKITLPFVLFATMPVLISQFVMNFNNFGIFFFLRSGFYIDGYFLASDTDLLINWLYNLSIVNNYYSIGAAISFLIFLITSAISIGVYVASPSYRQESMYK